MAQTPPLHPQSEVEPLEMMQDFETLALKPTGHRLETLPVALAESVESSAVETHPRHLDLHHELPPITEHEIMEFADTPSEASQEGPIESPATVLSTPIYTSLPEPRETAMAHLYYSDRHAAWRQSLEHAMTPTELQTWLDLVLAPRAQWSDLEWIQHLAAQLHAMPALFDTLLHMIGWVGPNPLSQPMYLDLIGVHRSPLEDVPKTTSPATSSPTLGPNSAPEDEGSEIDAKPLNILPEPRLSPFPSPVLQSPRSPAIPVPVCDETALEHSIPSPDTRVQIRSDANGSVEVHVESGSDSASPPRAPHDGPCAVDDARVSTSPAVDATRRRSRCQTTTALPAFSAQRLIDNYATLQRARSLARERCRTCVPAPVAPPPVRPSPGDAHWQASFDAPITPWF